MFARINQIFESMPKLAQFLWILVLGSLLLVGIIFFYISSFLLPDTEELENPKYELSSVIYSDDNKTSLGNVFRQNREWLSYDQINPAIVNALVATEDERFHKHSGIDFKGTLRAFIFMGSKGGASTISQQLAKLFFTERADSKFLRLWQKLKEWVIAVHFERRYTKEEILSMYLNKHDFLHGGIGISTASKTYFGKPQEKLTVDEAAVLIGMLKNPRTFNPKSKPKNAENRKTIVLGQMLKNKYITQQEYEKYKAKKINMSNFEPAIYYSGKATHFRAELIKYVRNLLNDTKYRKADGTKYNIFTDGLKIYTTINADMQGHAETAMMEHMKALQKKYFAVWQNNDPWTYDGEESEIQVRRNHLIETMRQSERFKSMREKMLGPAIEKLQEDFPKMKLTDVDIFRLFNASDDESYLAKLSKDEMATTEQIDGYRKILKSSHWPTIKTKWTKLKKDADVVFRKPVSMRIYNYETGGDKTVTMSPLDSIKHHLKHMQIGSIAVDPKTGQIKTWIGGLNQKYFQYDHVTSNRQVGSTIKPFIYSTAIIDQAMSPCLKVQDKQYCIEANDNDFGLASTWCPDNSDGKNTGESLTLKEALKQSKNSVSVYLMKQIGNVERVRSFINNLWIDKNKLPQYPSICLGTPELSVMDMATAYSAFANEGTLSKPFFITKIEDKNGKTIYTASPEHKKAINPSYNYVIVDMLKYVATTIQGKFKSEIAGKTGTTNDYKDGWYVGFTPNLVVSTWVGGDVPWIRFKTLADGQGAVMARPFFERLLTSIENDPKINFDTSIRFNKPEEMKVEMDCSKYDALQKPIENPTNEEKKKDEFDDEFDN
jgi:penicillin-binding protein 1A